MRAGSRLIPRRALRSSRLNRFDDADVHAPSLQNSWAQAMLCACDVLVQALPGKSLRTVPRRQFDLVYGRLHHFPVAILS